MTKRPSRRSVTIRDIAEQAGFAASTVSIVLNHAPLAKYIRKSTKQKIEAVALQLGYTPNQLARSLRSQRNQTVGVMVFDITDPYSVPILRGVESTLYHADYVGIMADAHNDPARFQHSLEMLLERRIEGLVVVANWLCVDINILADLEKKKVPTVTIGKKVSDSINYVMVDNEAGARLGIEHLYRLGHREIAFIRGPKMQADTTERWAGIRSFARASGITIDSKLIVDLPNSPESLVGFEVAMKLTEELLRRGKRFTALMAFDDMTALGAIRALNNAGISVPMQCSVLGFDDILPASLAFPSLSTVRQPLDAMGVAAVEIVLDSVKSELETMDFLPVRKRLLPELVHRESTSKLG